VTGENKSRAYSFFSHRECEYFPCHEGIPADSFNCLFCYCPLYLTDCAGNCTLTEKGVKDCSFCTFPHWRENYGIVIERLRKAAGEPK